MTKKRIVIAVVVLGLAGLSLPVYNLVVPLNPSRLASLEPEDEVEAKAVAVLEQKCMSCHGSKAELPFYAQFPIAKQLMEYDIRVGTSYVDYIAEFFPEEARPVSEVALAKTEYVADHKTMPPPQYLIMYWNHFLTEADQEALREWIGTVRKAHYATPGISEELQAQVIQPLPQEVQVDARKAALGDKLYHDKRLSKDDSLACAGCHALDKGGTDQKQFSEGVGGAMGDINGPTTLNASYQFLQFWDGRAADLQEQAAGPVENPIEMAATFPDVIEKLNKDEAFVAAFTAVYPEGLSKETITDAIAAFEETLITPNSPFDKYLLGDANAMTADQKQGYAVFLDYACATCHVGAAMGGQSFEKMGLKADYFGDRGNVHKPDYGRYNVTEKEEDRFKLKVPTLRNIALTFPYLHDGSTSDLEEVVEIMAKYQVGRGMSQADTVLVAAFLGALTGELHGKPL